MLRVTRVHDDIAWLQFKGSPYSEPIRIEWNPRVVVCVIDRDIAETVLRLGYARNPTDNELAAYNELIDRAAPKPAPVVEPEPEPEPDVGEIGEADPEDATEDAPAEQPKRRGRPPKPRD